MKRFNSVITIEVPVDQIAQQLLDNMSPDFKHRENTVEAIVGTLMNENRLSALYNALNGYSNDIDFKEGDIVYCNTKERYEPDTSTGDGSFKRKSPYLPIGQCTVEEIDLYRQKKLVVSWLDNEGKLQKSNVYHTECSKEFPLMTTLAV